MAKRTNHSATRSEFKGFDDFLFKPIKDEKSITCWNTSSRNDSFDTCLLKVEVDHHTLKVEVEDHTLPLNRIEFELGNSGTTNEEI